MSLIQRIAFEAEARRLIGRARRVTHAAARRRTGETPPCLACRLHLCRFPAWAVHCAAAVVLAAEVFVIVHII